MAMNKLISCILLGLLAVTACNASAQPRPVYDAAKIPPITPIAPPDGILPELRITYHSRMLPDQGDPEICSFHTNNTVEVYPHTGRKLFASLQVQICDWPARRVTKSLERPDGEVYTEEVSVIDRSDTRSVEYLYKWWEGDPFWSK